MHSTLLIWGEAWLVIGLINKQDAGAVFSASEARLAVFVCSRWVRCSTNSCNQFCYCWWNCFTDLPLKWIKQYTPFYDFKDRLYALRIFIYMYEKKEEIKLFKSVVYIHSLPHKYISIMFIYIKNKNKCL